MSKALFRPPRQQLHDSEDEEDDDDASVGQSRVGTKKRENSAKLSSSDDDNDGEEEEEEEDDEREVAVASRSKAKGKRKGGGTDHRGGGNKRAKASSFFEEEAEASTDEEYEEERRRGGGDAGEHMDREALEAMKLQDRRRAQAGASFLRRADAEIAKEFEERHRMSQPQRPRISGVGVGHRASNESRQQRSTSDDVEPPLPVEHYKEMADEEGGPEAYAAVAQQSLVPSVSDPSFWMVSCAPGKEQEMVLQIMNKAIAQARLVKPLGITGAIAAQSRGKIYIESFNEPAVLEAIQNVRGLLPYSMRLVPIGDMTTVMTVTSKKKPVQKNEWVRMTRGHYKGDLALVMEVRDSGLKCIVQCVPRLDLGAMDLQGEEARMRRKTVRPPQKFFNPEELKAVGKVNIIRQLYPGLNIYCYLFEGNYYMDGFLLKEMTVGSMVKQCTEEDPPTLDELQRFQRRQGGGRDGDDDHGGRGEDDNEASKRAASLLDELAELQKKTGFDKQQQKDGGLLIGDTIEVIEGDLIGVRGKIVSLDGSTVKVKPTSADVTEEVEFLASQVRKHIPEGTHVKVVDGRYANETGVVVAVEKLEGGGGPSSTDYTAVILTDITNKEITVRISQLRESAEVASGQDKLQGYELYDLVVLSGGGSANEVGVIVRVGREDFTVVNNHGIAREVRPEELRGKKNTMSSKAVALDAQGNHIRCGDTVNVVEGRHKGKAATIKRMNRSQLFLHSQTRSEHAGIFVVKSRSCVLAGSRTQRSTGTGDGGASPWTPQSNQNSRGPGPSRKRDDGLIGKTVRIQAGPWKGMIGTVSDTTGTHVQVELHARLKKVMVTHERVHVVGDKFGATETQSSNAIINPTALAPTTPFVGAGQTPMHGGATPMHGSVDDSGGDEVWRPGGSIDQETSFKDSNNDGWGSTATSVGHDPDTGGGVGGGGDENDGWGSSSYTQAENEWGAPPPAAATEVKKVAGGVASIKVEASGFNNGTGVSVKKEQQQSAAASEMEHELPDNEERPGWLMERVFVILKRSGTRGYIVEIRPGQILVELDDGSTEKVGMNDITMETPVEHDPVLVTGGNGVGLEGKLVCIDGTDAILQDSRNGDFKIVEFSFLAKVKV